MIKNYCLFCKEVLTGEEPPEHIIPDALLSNADKDVTIKNVCSSCNHLFGRTIDSDFTNSSHIKYLTFKHAQYLTEKKIKNKKSIKEKFKLAAPNGDELKIFRIIDDKGIRLVPKPGPQKFMGRNFLFIDPKKERNSKVLQDAGVENIEISIENPEELNKFEANVNFSKFICKVALEYICLKYGDIAYETKFDDLRNFVIGHIDKLPDWQKGKIEDMDINPLNTFYRFSRHDEHTIGIYNRFDQWFFMLSIFNVTSFHLMIPVDERYEKHFETIKISK